MRLVAQTTSLPLPGILCHDETRELAPSDFFVMDYIEGLPLNKAREGFGQATRDRLDRSIARYLRELNSLRAESFGLFSPETPRYAAWRECFEALLEGLLADGIDAGVDLGRPYAGLRALLLSRLPVLDSVEIPRFVHWDLWDGNIFVDPAGDSVRGFIDFERALWGDPLMEVNFASWNAKPAFLEAYGDGRQRGSKPLPGSPPPGITEGEGARTKRILYDLYLDLVMVIECSYRAYETDDQEKWARGNLEAHLAELGRLP
jgi:aminoglycoside phosphotransferase (APT) family kinase protein